MVRRQIAFFSTMGLTISRARVKEKCSIDSIDFDDTIDNLIAEITPVLEHVLHAEALGSDSTGLQATLNLGATEIVCGELLRQMLRAAGASDMITIGDVRVQPHLSEPSDLIASGYARLAPYLLTSDVTSMQSRVRFGSEGG